MWLSEPAHARAALTEERPLLARARCLLPPAFEARTTSRTLSGWCSRASARNARVTSSSLAPTSTPSAAHGPSVSATAPCAAANASAMSKASVASGLRAGRPVGPAHGGRRNATHARRRRALHIPAALFPGRLRAARFARITVVAGGASRAPRPADAVWHARTCVRAHACDCAWRRRNFAPQHRREPAVQSSSLGCVL